MYCKMIIIDLLGQSRDFADFDSSISKDSYVLGVYEDEIYILDRSQKKEYTFNVKSRKLKEVGNKEKNAKMYRKGQIQIENIYTVSDNKSMFDEGDYNQEIEQKYHPIFMKETKEKFYFVTSDYKVYYVLKEDLDTKVLLFQDSNLKDLKVIDDYLFYLSNDSIYAYQLNQGLHKIVSYSELSYNNKNIFEVVKK